MGAEVRSKSKNTKTDVKLYIMLSKIYAERNKTHVLKTQIKPLEMKIHLCNF